MDTSRKSSLTNSEKPNHLQYLRDFRVEPCAQFKQHQCQQHRPYTCFHWHFANQRRRRPVKLTTGEFNYSPDIYCDKYDESNGCCPNGDSCIYLHRVAGDVERKYHPRYYKTALCVHTTDARGFCTKNGPHCAFAHSAQDLRHSQLAKQNCVDELAIESVGRDRTSFVVEDTLWHDQVYVLSYYKTELCRKPARLCRQGYACPYYHNSKDKRRPPALHKYRSTPCPAAKTVDEWLSPEQCENGDDCGYCHTRTEQQFHPEIYKSTKCNDIVEHGYCPRAVFCAFAHHESEFHIQRTPYRKPIERPTTPIPLQQVSRCGSNLSPSSHADSSSADVSSLISSSTTAYSVLLDQSENESLSYLKDDDLTVKTYSKALGYDPTQISPRSSVDSAIGRIRTSSFTLGQLDLGCSVTSDNIVSSLPTFSSLSSVRRLTAEKPSRTLPLAIDELSVEDVTSAISSLSNRQQQTQGNDILTSTTLSSPSSPLNIPGSASPFGSSSPLTAFGESLLPQHRLLSELSQPIIPAKNRTNHSLDTCNISDNGVGLCDIRSREELQLELNKKSEELRAHHRKLSAWEEGLKQAREACEAWKKDAEYHRQIAEQAENEKIKAVYERDQALMQVEVLRNELQNVTSGIHRSAYSIGSYFPAGHPCTSFITMPQGSKGGKSGTEGPVCARCGREKLVDSRNNASCRLCCN